jgi:endonuclease YncB( thermonuclease family)
VGHSGGQSGLVTRRGLGFALAGFAAGCGGQADLSVGEQGRISRITDGDVLNLDTGLRVRLVEVEAPALGYDGRADEPFAPEARDMLAAAALGRQAKLWYGGLSRDTYKRALAHVIAADETGADVWLNGYMIRQGAARVRTWPDNSRRARRLLALEQEARTARRGLWALDHWRIRTPGDLEDTPNLAIIEGTLAAVDQTSGEGVAHLSSSGIRLDIGEKLGPRDTALDLSVGVKVRIRGRIDARSGEPQIRITHWAQVESG